MKVLSNTLGWLYMKLYFKLNFGLAIYVIIFQVENGSSGEIDNPLVISHSHKTYIKIESVEYLFL